VDYLADHPPQWLAPVLMRKLRLNDLIYMSAFYLFVGFPLTFFKLGFCFFAAGLALRLVSARAPAGTPDFTNAANPGCGSFFKSLWYGNAIFTFSF
jgi:hypothetical protein